MSREADARRELRELLTALLARTPGAQGLYIPRGEAGISRMIRALLAMGAGEGAGEPLAGQIERFVRASCPPPQQAHLAKGSERRDPHQGAVPPLGHPPSPPDRGAGGA